MTMRVDIPGLVIDRNRNGTPRYRVRVVGDKKRRITLPVAPDHPEFMAHYKAARYGEAVAPVTKAEPQTMQWLVDRYMAWLRKRVDAGLASRKTLTQRRNLLKRFCGDTDEAASGRCPFLAVKGRAAVDAYVPTVRAKEAGE